MGFKGQFNSRKTNSLEEVLGSDGRWDTSSRSAHRSYYVSRDSSLAFTMVWDDASSAAGDFIAYWQNTDSNGLKLVIIKVTVCSANAASFKVHQVTGTPVGTSVTPFCLNRSPTEVANATAVEAAGTAITGLTSSGVFAHEGVVAGGSHDINFDSELRLGQNDALAVEYEQGTTGRTWGTIHGFYEVNV